MRVLALAVLSVLFLGSAVGSHRGNTSGPLSETPLEYRYLIDIDHFDQGHLLGETVKKAASPKEGRGDRAQPKAGVEAASPAKKDRAISMDEVLRLLGKTDSYYHGSVIQPLLPHVTDLARRLPDLLQAVHEPMRECLAKVAVSELATRGPVSEADKARTEDVIRLLLATESYYRLSLAIALIPVTAGLPGRATEVATAVPWHTSNYLTEALK